MGKYLVTVDGKEQEVSTVKEVAQLLGVSRIKKADIEAGKVDGVLLVEEEVPTDEGVADVQTEEEALTTEEEYYTDPDEEYLKDMEAAQEDEVAGDTDEDTEALTNGSTEEDTDEVEDEQEAIEYPEVGEFKTVKEIKRFIKKLTDEQLYEWCELEGVVWKHNEHPAINRMRAAMAMKAKHFPETAPKKGGKSKSKYAQYTTEELVQMALDNDVPVRDDKGDARILRMYTIMALRDAGIID